LSPAELYQRGYSVAMTLGNAKANDLFAEQRPRTVNVQVKTIRDNNDAGFLSGHPTLLEIPDETSGRMPTGRRRRDFPALKISTYGAVRRTPSRLSPGCPEALP